MIFNFLISRLRPLAVAGTLSGLLAMPAIADPNAAQVGKSPWGPKDEIGRLNLITPESRTAIFSRADARRVYDLSVEYFVGMPSWQAVGDPNYQIWLTHTPNGTVVDDPVGVGKKQNELVSYTGMALSMYTHTGTHIDALNHFGLHGKVWNGFDAKTHLGDRGWKKTGAEKIPPIVARGVLIDVAAAHGVEELPPGYRVLKKDLVEALKAQKVTLQKGDVVLVRTGRMKQYNNKEAYMSNTPGLGMDAARFLIEETGAIAIGADNLSFETFPPEEEGNYLPLHTYLLGQQGAYILEVVELSELSRDKVYEFAFIGASLKLRGADAAPMRPIAIPLRN